MMLTISLLLTVLLSLCSDCAPLVEDLLLDEDPTLDPLLAPPSVERNTTKNELICNLNRCLKLRDESRDLRSHGCIPDVFSTDADVPLASQSNTILSFLSVNTSIVDNQLHFIIDNLQDLSTGTIHTNAIHLRIHKAPIPNDKLLTTMLREGGLRLSLTVSNSSRASAAAAISLQSAAVVQYHLQELIISRTDMINEGWLDFRLDQAKFLSVYNSRLANVNQLHLQVTILADTNIKSFKDIGIDNITPDSEPVLIIYGQEQVQQLIMQKLLSNPLPTTATTLQQKSKRSILTDGGSGTLTDIEKCRLVPYEVAFTTIGLNVEGHFNLNFCSGQCVYPVPHKQGDAMYYHPLLMSVFHSQERNKETADLSPPCCVPISYMSVSVVVPESEWTYVSRTFPSMSATECSCR